MIRFRQVDRCEFETKTKRLFTKFYVQGRITLICDELYNNVLGKIAHNSKGVISGYYLAYEDVIHDPNQLSFSFNFFKRGNHDNVSDNAGGSQSITQHDNSI